MTISVSIVINTFNRARLVDRAVQSVLRQSPAAAEVIVIDDGSTDDTSRVLTEFGDQITVVHQANQGLCAARNTGLTTATSRWVGFLDDDDSLMPGTLAAVARLDTGDAVGAICGGIVYRSPRSGRATFTPPTRRDAMFGHRIWNYMPGSFFVRRELLLEIGGYRPELTAQHQTDLIWRLTDLFDRRQLQVSATDAPFVTMERGEYRERPLMRPELMLSGSEDMLQFHRQRFEREPSRRADYLSIVGVNHARLGHTRESRTALAEAVRAHCTPRTVARAALAATPAAGRWWWERRRGEPATPSPAEQPPPAAAVHLANVRDLLPGNYVRNPQASADVGGTPYWAAGSASHDDRHQVPVYRHAARLAERASAIEIADIGSGSGSKALRFLAGPGRRVTCVDQPSAVAVAEGSSGVEWLAGDLSDPALWSAIRERSPQLIVCADVIEHLDDPHRLLAGIAGSLAAGGKVVLSTPDRGLAEVARPFGPPANPRHVVEWLPDEMRALLASHGLTVSETVHMLPRSYSPTLLELKRVVWRLVRRRACPDRRRCVVFVAEAGRPG